MEVPCDRYSLKCACILFLPMVFLILFLYIRYKLQYWKRRGVPQLNKTNKVFGDFKNAILFRTSPGYHLGEIYREAPSDAPYVGFYIFHKPCLLLKDPEIIKQVLIRDFDNFANRHFAGSSQKDSIGMINLFGLKNPAWRYLRRKITATFSRNKLKQMLPLMLHTSQTMMNYLQSVIGNEGQDVIDAQDVSYKYTANLIANVALGTETDSFSHPHSDYSKCVMNFFHSFKRMIALVTVFFMPELVGMFGSCMLLDMSVVRKLFWSAVTSRETSGEVRGDYIDSIVQLKNGEQDPVYRFEGDNLLFQAGTFFSGFESSSTVATFTLMELAKHKKYQNIAREDIKDSINKYGWTIEGFNAMKYLDRCVAESVRLHPPISTIDRCPVKDYKIPNTDTVIEEGTPIYISLYGLHRDPQFFDDPDVYNPARHQDNGVHDAYLPFGAGPRKCVGERLGQLHVKVVLSKILSEYEVYQTPTDINELNPRATLTAAANGINIAFTKLIK